MLAVIQLVNQSSVKINGDNSTIRKIGRGLTVFLGVSINDTESDVEKLVNKLTKLRIFPDKEEKMNLSISDIAGEILLISQFTLLGDLKGNNRPDFSKAAGKELALKLYELTGQKIKELGIKIQTGYFGEHMIISQELDGPVTINLDTNNL